MNLTELLARKHIAILDGAMGTELQRLGVAVELPLWSADALLRAPHVVRNIHFACLHAGADIITTNTFRTNPRTLRRAGMEDRWEEMNLKAVQFAVEARERYIPSRPVLIAGGLAPVEDCYRPELVPSNAELLDEHTRQAELLSMFRVDFFLVETMLSTREAVIATRAAATTGKEVATSFVCREDGQLLSGDKLEDAAREVVAAGASAILLNCISARLMPGLLSRLRASIAVPIGCYANIGSPEANACDEPRDDVDVEDFAKASSDWVRAGARIVGGCCGTTPEYIEALTRMHSPDSLLLQEEEITAWRNRDRHSQPAISPGDEE